MKQFKNQLETTAQLTYRNCNFSLKKKQTCFQFLCTFSRQSLNNPGMQYNLRILPENQVKRVFNVLRLGTCVCVCEVVVCEVVVCEVVVCVCVRVLIGGR